MELLSDDDGFGFVVGDISKYNITIWGIMSSGGAPKKPSQSLVSKVALLYMSEFSDMGNWFFSTSSDRSIVLMPIIQYK